MKRMSRVAAAATLAVALSLGVSAGPVFAAETEAPASTTPVADSAPSSASETPTTKPVPTSRPAPTSKPSPTTEPSPTSVKPSETAVKDPPSSEPAPASVPSTAPVSTTSASTPTAAAEEQPDLRLTVAFDQPSYRPDDWVRARATVVNAGTGTATGVRLTDSGTLASHTWEIFNGRYVVLAPGQTAEDVTVARIADITGNEVRLTVEVAATEPDAEPADNAVTITAPLTVVRGGFTGIAYGDRNRDHVIDPGEVLAGLRIRAWGEVPGWSAETVTDSAGRFAFHDLLAGSWTVGGDSADWMFAGVTVEVTGDGEPAVVVRGDYDTTGWLSGSARFFAPTYAVGDTARFIVTVANSGRAQFPGLIANCSASDYEAPIDVGDLDPAGPGVTVPAATSRNFEMTVPVRPEAVVAGYLEANCWMGVPGSGGWIRLTAIARVPGARAPKSVGYVVTPVFNCGPCHPTYRPVPGVKVYLRNQVTGAIVSRAVSGADGSLVIFDLPADRYDVGIVGPWR